MIRSYFGLTVNPFTLRDIELLEHQQEVYDTLTVHFQQGGLCLVVGTPGTGKSVIKESLKRLPEKQYLVDTVARTLHTYTNTVKILCEAFRVAFETTAFKCDRRLIEQAFSHNHTGKLLVTIIDDAQLMEMENLRKLRLLFEDFPKNHILILIGHAELPTHFNLPVNQYLESRVTYSVISRRLHPASMRAFMHRELDRLGLPHSTFTEAATGLIIRSADGILRKCRNLCLATMLDAVRASSGRTMDIDLVNRVLIQIHWQKEIDITDF
jgi:type II secretory pathway predicted ATPase ExeA